MPRADLTDLTVILDRSGSMSACRVEAVGGLNAFVDKQKADPGETLFTLVQFDTQYEFVHSGIPIKSVPKLDLDPRGFTALLDAVGRAIIETGQRLEKIPDDQRPGLVVMVIITDGMENASKEFTRDRIKQMIQHQQEKYNWQFTFLGANQDAFAEAQNMGISRAAAANYDVQNAGLAFTGAAANVSRMKAARGMGVTGQSLSAQNAYSDEERQAMSADPNNGTNKPIVVPDEWKSN